MIASVISVALMINQLRSVIDVFQLADPTGSLGIYFYAGGLAAALVFGLRAARTALERAGAIA